MHNPFVKLGLPENPVILAPLAGVSDHPFRRVCSRFGADLTYVEMLSATALIYENKRTYEMFKRHESESVLGVQITSKTAEEAGKAVAILDKYSFDTIDLNMGCPVTKVCRNGGGSAIMKDPERVYDTVKACIENTDLPVSVKVRLGWDKQTVTCYEVVDAAEKAGAKWVTLHGRLRNDDYSIPVNLEMIAEAKRRLSIPLIGNGNIFSHRDAVVMREATNVDGIMVSRGALGNPFLFREIKSGSSDVNIDEWAQSVTDHLDWQGEEYGDSGMGSICMRKHMLWYLKGWPGGKKTRELVVKAETISEARKIIEDFTARMKDEGIVRRLPLQSDTVESRFVWDPKFEMDRKLDRGVGAIDSDAAVSP
jgi:tRNA-dihydrouridine synthase B